MQCNPCLLRPVDGSPLYFPQHSFTVSQSLRFNDLRVVPRRVAFLRGLHGVRRISDISVGRTLMATRTYVGKLLTADSRASALPPPLTSHLDSIREPHLQL